MNLTLGRDLTEIESRIGRAQPPPVRTLWVQRTGKGPRWIPDLKRWYKSDHLRQINEETDLLKTISEPTRKPGE